MFDRIYKVKERDKINLIQTLAYYPLSILSHSRFKQRITPNLLQQHVLSFKGKKKLSLD